MPNLFHQFYTQSEDYPELNDHSVFEYLDGVVTLGCSDDNKSYKVSGPVPTKATLEGLEKAQGDNPLCADDPDFALDHLGLTNEGATELPEKSGLRPPKW